MGGTERARIKPGLRVSIVLKADQRSGKLTEGIVKDILTNSPVHPHGIKVRLESGQVGRVKEIKIWRWPLPSMALLPEPPWDFGVVSVLEKTDNRQVRNNDKDSLLLVLSEILVDTDARPMKQEVYRVIKRYGLKVTLVADSGLDIPVEGWIELVVVSDHLDAANDWIVNHITKNDIMRGYLY